MQKAKYKHILIVSKTGHAPAHSFAQTVQKWLTEHDCQSKICAADELEKLGLTHKPDLVVVLGGDGTMLGVGRTLAGQRIPIMGINFGRVGFLTLASQTNWSELLSSCLTGAIPLQPRLTLNWRILRNGTPIDEGNAVNDVVISHGALARLISVDIRINEEEMGILRCDGIIFASPMGSSGYTASAGGPILYSQTDAFVFTPICPFLRSVSPMVFPSNVIFHVRIEQGTWDCCLTVDGQEGHAMTAGDLLELSAEPDSIFFLGNEEIFFERLRTRGLVLEQTYNRQARFVSKN